MVEFPPLSIKRRRVVMLSGVYEPPVPVPAARAPRRSSLRSTGRRASSSTVSWFRFDYQQSTLTLQMSTDCQRIGHLEGNACTITAINGLPATEPT